MWIHSEKIVRDMVKTYSQMHRIDKYSQHNSIIWLVLLNGWVFVCELSGCGFDSRCSFLNFRYGTCFEQGIECRFTLKLLRDIIKSYSQMNRTDMCSKDSSIIWPAWLNGWVFVCKLSGCGFKLRCCHLKFRFGACFEQGVPWNSDKLKSVDSLWNSYGTW